jgi:hypothetical protein
MIADTDSDETFCRVCSEPMGDEDGHTHNECHEAANEEFAWYQ